MKTVHLMSLAAALALPLCAGSAAAQSSQDNPAPDNDYIRHAVRIDKTFNQSSVGGCKYTVSVNGTITPQAPASDTNANAQAPIVTPRLSVAAQAVCPNTTAVKVTDSVLGTGPLTWKQLGDSLSSRSHVYTVEKAHQCTYGATFSLVSERLEVSRFDHNCSTI